jgi:hypothetical protein
MFRSKNNIVGSFCLLAALCVLARGGSIYSTGFEQPTFAPNQALGNQDSWQEWNGSASAAVVGCCSPSSEIYAGQQSVTVVAEATNANTQTGIYHQDTASGSPLIDLNAELEIVSTETENTWQFAGLGAGLIPYIGGINIVPTGPATDTIYSITAASTAIGTFTRQVGVVNSAWHDVDLLFNFSTQTYNITLDGTLLAANVPFCGGNATCTGAFVSEATFPSFFDVFADIGGNDFAYMDNLSVSSVPEPATYGLTGAALVAGAFLLRRARKR